MNPIISFDQLPEAVNQLNKKLEKIEKLLLATQTQQSAEAPDKLLTVEETAQFLKLTVPTIYSKVSKRELPVMKRGKRLYFSQSELMAYLKSGYKKTYDQISDEAGKHQFKRQ